MHLFITVYVVFLFHPISIFSIFAISPAVILPSRHKTSITKDEVKNDELEELMKKYFDNSPVKLFTSVVNLADKQELKKIKKIIKNTANL